MLSSDTVFEWVENEEGEHLLKYDGILYDGKAHFLNTLFDCYFPVAYRVKYNSNDIFWLSGNQRTRLSYQILNREIGAKSISLSDDSILKSIAGSGKHEAAKRWLGRMNWNNGNANMITFGVGYEVKGAANGVFCYRPEYYDNKATFTAEKMTWEQWSEKIIATLDSKRYHIDDVIMMMYYQDGVYMTLPKTEQKAIKGWIYKGYRERKPFPYSGVVPNGNVNFTIDFDRDCEIVKSESLRHNGNMAINNRVNADELAVARGEARTKNVADADYEKLIGDEWTTAELKEILKGDYERKIRRLIDAKKIERVRRGFYRRKL